MIDRASSTHLSWQGDCGGRASLMWSAASLRVRSGGGRQKPAVAAHPNSGVVWRMSSEISHGEVTAHGIRRSLAASVHRACRGCGAPGIFKEAGTFTGDYPAIIVSHTDPRLGQPVGDVCPHCDTPRPIVEDRGEIWSQEVAL